MVKTEQKIKQEISSEKSSASSSKSSSSSGAAAAAVAACKKTKKYRGVRMRSWGSWVSEIRAPNQKTRIWLGSYSTAEAAAKAYDAALICLRGSSANLNFPITSSHYIPDAAMSPKSIQRVAAAAAANSFANDNIIDSNAIATNTTTTPPISPPLPSSSSYLSSSSSISSPSLSSSPSDRVDDDVSLMHSLGSYNEPISMMEPLSWYNFDGIQSPKYADQMFSSFDQPLPMMDDFWEDGDIRLWSFC